MLLRCSDIELFYEVRGEGPDVVLLHPYPSDHRFWLPIAPYLDSRFRLILPDLRGLGRSGVAGDVTTMAMLADDVKKLCDELNVQRATFIGCSVGGYTLFEFFRRHAEQVKALVLMDTRAGADTEEARTGRLRTADEIMQKGPAWGIEQMLPKLLSPLTLNSRLNVLAAAKATMAEARAEGMAAMQRGMASRVDSMETLAHINVPTLVLGGEDDAASPASELEKIARGIRGAELKIVDKAGHFAAFEQPREVGRILREFLERNGR